VIPTAILLVVAARRGLVMGRHILPDEVDPQRFPVAAVAAARRQQLDTRVYASTLSWSGYVEYAWPEARLFIDGSTDFHGSGLMRAYRDVKALVPGWTSTLDRWRVGTVLTAPESRLAGGLSRRPGWRIAYCDNDAVVIVRDSTATAVAPSGCAVHSAD
jgi:hypothetical protein